MAIELLLDSLDTVEEEHKALYKETDGKFALNLEAYAEYVKSPVLKKNADLVGRLGKAKATADKFKDVDEEKFKSFLEWSEKQVNDDADDDTPPKPDGKPPEPGANLADLQAKWEKRSERAVAKVRDELTKVVAEKDKQIAALQDKHLSFMKETMLDQIGIKAGVLPERLESWKKTTRDRFRFGEEQELIALDDDNDPLDVKPEKFAAEILLEKFPWFYRAPEQGGSGSSGGGNGKGFGGKKKKDYDRKGKEAFISKHGYPEWSKLPD